MDTHHPDVIAIERVFSQQNVSTVMGTAAGGVIAPAAAKRGIDVHFHTPSEVKAAVTGNGGAGKAQVTAMVTKILALQPSRRRPTRRCVGPGDLPLLARADDRADGPSRGAGRRATPQVRGQTEGGEMIASVHGEVLDIALDHVVIEAAGVGQRDGDAVDAGDPAPRR